MACSASQIFIVATKISTNTQEASVPNIATAPVKACRVASLILFQCPKAACSQQKLPLHFAGALARQLRVGHRFAVARMIRQI